MTILIKRAWLILRRSVFSKYLNLPFVIADDEGEPLSLCGKQKHSSTRRGCLRIQFASIPQSTSNRWHECEMSLTPQYHLPFRKFFSPLALSLITELFLFLSHCVTFWFQLRRFITDIFKPERVNYCLFALMVRYVTTEIPLTAFHPGLRLLKKSRENTIAFHSIFGRWK